MKRLIKFFLFLWIISCLSGCGRYYAQPAVQAQITERIDIRCDNCQDTLLLTCTEPERLRLILLTLRKLGPDFPANTDVEALSGRTLTLTLYCADGTRQTYRIRNNQYLQKNDGPWRKINARHAGGLYQLLVTLGTPSATESPARRAYSPSLRNLPSVPQK